MKWLSYMMILLLFLSGCANKKGYTPAPEILAPSREIKAEIRSIGVVPETMHTNNTELSLHDKQTLNTMGENAVVGAGTGIYVAGEVISAGCSEPTGCAVAIILAPALILVGGVVGGVAGATIGAANPELVPVNPTDQQKQLVNSMVTADSMSITSDEHVLQQSLVDYGNRMTPYHFASVDEQVIIDDLKQQQMTNSMSVDAHLLPSHLQILLVGEQSSDPKLKLVVRGKYTLSRSTRPDQCLGWYSTTWTSSSKKLSSWSKDDSALFKQELLTAIKEQSHEAITFLFSTDENSAARQQTYDSYPEWMECYDARYQDIKRRADWFCPGADNGIADSQRRIGDMYYRSGAKDGVVHSYVWYSLAAAGNNAEANRSLIQVREELSPEQHVRADNLLENWKPGSCKSEIMSLANEVMASP